METPLSGTSVIRSPRYYDLFFATLQNRHSVPRKNPSSLKRPTINTAKFLWPIDGCFNGVPR